MPRGIPKTDKVSEAITLLAEAIKGLETKVDSLKSPTLTVTTGEQHSTVTVPPFSVSNENSSNDIFPQQWRQIVNERLNHKFKSSVVYRSDMPCFELSIWVPKEYSNVPKGHWDLNKEDRRMKVIENAMGEIGVREYIDKIAENLGSDIMMRVHEDAQKLVTV